MQRWPWYAPVFGAYPLLYIAVSNPGQVQAGEVATVVAVGLLAVITLVMLIRPFVASWLAAGAGAAWVVLLFYLYGPVNEWWLDWVRAGLEQKAAGETWYNANPQLVHSVAWALVALAGLARLRHARSWPGPSTTGWLNFIALLITAMLAIQATANFLRADEGPEATAAASGAKATAARQADMPDIYFIVLDGYARADILSKYYDFDNSTFLNGLRARGFQVSDESRSNFYWTFLSLGSALNLDYIQSLVNGPMDPGSRDRTEMYRLLRDNQASKFLRERGYRIVHLQSTWGGTGSNPYADEFLPCHAGLFGNEYLRAVADASWLRALESRASLDVANCHLRNFETLAAQSMRPGPKFVFAHFVPPHHPYLFDRHGNVLRRANLSDQFEFQKQLWEDRQSYIEQLLYINTRIGEAIDRLIADSPRPPVILLLSDHGPNLRRGMNLEKQQHIRLSNLTAMYLPGAPAGYVPSDTTPVNHLRRVFNLYFDAKLPLLPNRYFVSSYLRPFELQEVGRDDGTLPVERGF